jgi:hypothetical protein
MATITRTEEIEQIQEVLKAYENKIRDIRFDTEKLSPEGKNIVDSYCSNEENEQVLVRKAYSDKKFFQEMTDKEILQYHKICRELNQYLELGINNLEVVTKIEENKIIISSDTLKEVKYFLTKYKDLSNWEYDGHGCFVAKKNATLWELGGIYWDKLFELPENPDLIQIGDKIKLKEEVLNLIYEYSVADVKGNYSFSQESPDVKDLIYGIIGLYIGIANDIPKIIKLSNYVNDAYNIYDVLSTNEEEESKLSLFIQQYSTEGQEEDAWKKILTLGGLLGTVFSFLSLLGSASIEQNKYQIVQYNQRRAFLNSARYEIQRIQELKKSIKEKDFQTEIQYLRFLEKQIELINREIELNSERENQQQYEILYSFSQYNTRGVIYKDTRIDTSPPSYHEIDYYQIFKETL